jgi:hypothetical protein
MVTGEWIIVQQGLNCHMLVCARYCAQLPVVDNVSFMMEVDTGQTHSLSADIWAPVLSYADNRTFGEFTPLKLVLLVGVA